MAWRVPGTVRRVVDGDTFLANLDLGWHTWAIPAERKASPGWVRILDLYCPELREPGGLAARTYAAELLPHGTVVTIESTELDSFGRALSHVTLPDGRDFAETMIAAGHGKATR